MVFCGADFDVSKTPTAPAALGLAAKKAVNGAARKSKNIRELAAHSKSLMESSNGVGWHVAVGTDFAVDLRYRKGSCILLSSRGTKIKALLYRTTPALSPLPVEDHEALLTAPAGASAQKRLNQRVVVNESDMDAEMRALTIENAKRLLEHFYVDADAESKVAQALKHSLTFKYGHTWHVIVSSSRELCCLPHFVPGTRADFSLDKFRIVVYQHASAALDTRMDVTQFGNRAALLLALMALLVYAYFVFTATEADERCVHVKDADGTTRIAVGCKLQEVVRANTRAAWKGMALFATMLFTVVASGLRMYRSSLRQSQKAKLA